MLITEFWLCWADIYSCCCWCHFHCCRTTEYSDWCAPSGISIFCVLHHTIGPLYCCVFWQEIKLVKILHIKKGILSRQGSVWLATYWVLLTMPTEQSQWPPAGSLRSENNMAFIHTQRQHRRVRLWDPLCPSVTSFHSDRNICSGGQRCDAYLQPDPFIWT